MNTTTKNTTMKDTRAKTVRLYADVPQALIGIIGRIRYERVSSDERQALMKEVRLYAQALPSIRRRTRMDAPMREVSVPIGVPDDVIGAINEYDYTYVTAWQVALAMPLAEKTLRGRGLL